MANTLSRLSRISRIHDEFKFKLSDDEETFSDIEEKLYNDDSLNVFMM